MFECAFVNYDKNFLCKKFVSGKLLLVMAYIRLFASYSGRVVLCIDYMAKEMGYVPNRKPGKINDSIVCALEWLRQYDYIIYDMDITDSKKHSECFVCYINNDNNIFDMINENGTMSQFVQLTENEYQKIVKSSFKRKDWLISVFLHMKKRICINGAGRESAYCFAALDTITRDASKNVKISRTSVDNVIRELVKSRLLYEHITGAYVDCHNKIKKAVNFYALSDEMMNHTECDMIAKSYIEEQEAVVVNTFIK